MRQLGWENLVVERAARPVPISEDRFRNWMHGRSFFVSSRMDAEMTPAREVIRAYLHSLAAIPVMWEEIAPLDKGPDRAFLDGVDQSSIFILILGRKYGTPDLSGYSPTHKEGNRAADRKIPGLLFTLEVPSSAERDGKLNDWLNELFQQISGSTFSTPDELVRQLDRRLRELATTSDRFWIKLGNLIFPGKVRTDFGRSSAGQFTITARVSDGPVRRALMALGEPFSAARSAVDRLTWSDKSYTVQFGSVSSESESASEDTIEIKCHTPQNWHGESGSTLASVHIGGAPGPVERAEIWARRAIFGEAPPKQNRGWDLIASYTTPDVRSMPDVLAGLSASGWLAEGLTRLYCVEEVSRRFGGHFQHLEIGPTTATGVSVDGAFTIQVGMGGRSEVAHIKGIVPLNR